MWNDIKFYSGNEGNNSLGRPRCIWEDKTYVKIYLNEIFNDIGWENVGQISTGSGKVHWQALVKMVTKLYCR